MVRLTRPIPPFAYRETYTLRVTSANSSFQLARAPWADPVNRYFELAKVYVSNLDGAACAVHMWDQDLSSTTPATTGSAGTALVVLEGGASAASGTAALTSKYEDPPAQKFFAGIAVQATRINVSLTVEVDVV